MAKIKKRGESGAAKNYITRNQALKKLQISLSDFRRLCILKGIYPREPLNKKRANKGSSAPASFYYHKDVQYLLHEPLLVKFREHKAFAKKLARALGRGEWALAKNLEDAKPIARLDHLVKERYPTFTLALQDLQDPLNLVHLFSTLPTNPIPGKTLVPSEVIQECSRLISEWKVWAIKTHSLRKVFLGIKGVYYECTVPGHGGEPIRVRWLEGYEFQQHVPHDVDFRILLTFVELYRTLISFVLYRLYTEENLVYPRLWTRSWTSGKGVSKKEVKRAIKGIAAGVSVSAQDEDDDVEMDGETAEVAEEDFVERPSKNEAELSRRHRRTEQGRFDLPPVRALHLLPLRETSSRTWEFVIRAMGGRVVTAAQAPTLEGPVADGITHVIIDRPMTAERMREMQKGRKWVWIQPQWVADCVNRGKVLDAEEYAPGKLLPPHLSPWDGEGELERPWLDEINESGAALTDAAGEGEDEEEGIEQDEQEDSEEEEEDEEAAEENTPEYPPALLAAGVSHAAFRSQLKEATKANAPQAKTSKSAAGKTAAAAAASGDDADLRKIMMSNKKAKLYEKMKYSNRERAEEKEKLEAKRKAIEKRKAKEARQAGKA
ncbi:mRNA-binding ribosome synthesis protein nop7 [Saitozyma podzolica]|uniref:Pescadillo homolog n=1 Tax=Saitozyma podzolica TaxID=1890683 RepID=A0A427YS93_9TREE|nr:mRNA-binding ribosome synthesis protein nop7 [Saitozyma podzolica]